MLLIDDMGWASSSVQMDPNNPDSKSDYHLTPNLETLAQRGMVFSNAYAAGPMCSPTRASIQTGMTPAALQTTDVRQPSDPYHVRYQQYYAGYPLTPPQPRGEFPTATTIGEQLHQIDPNYQTGWFGKWDWWPRPDTDGYDVTQLNIGPVETPAEDPKAMFTITNQAMAFLDDSDQTEDPFFLLVSHDAVKNASARQATVDMFEGLTPGEKHRDPAYAAMHYDLDETIGTLMGRLDTMGITDNTYVMFLSDHGAAVGVNGQEIVNAPLYGGKGTIWEGAMRTPMIVSGPGIAPSSHSDLPISTIDLFPTIASLAGGGTPLPEGVEGADLSPVLFNSGNLPAGTSAIERANAANGELYFHFPHYGPTLNVGKVRPASSVRDGDYKLVRVYGENGAADELLLFDLSASLEESSDPNSPLNLASTMPDKVTELNTKLSNWIQAVDASLPYDVRTPIQLDWDASTSAPTGADWRSQQDVDSYDRETWRAAPGSEPTRIAIDPFQSGLGENAYNMSGNKRLYRRFFHVSDPQKPDEIDGDNSASFEMWVRLDSMNSNQLLFEQGSSTQGISLTLGDADGDSEENDLRFRLLALDGQHLTVTAPVDQFADPTQDFVQVAAVINDSPLGRYIELYINGALAGRADGVAGPDGMNWNHRNKASIGKDIDTIGGSSGAGDLPFTGGTLKGQVAAIRFQNYAISSQDVLASYNSKLDPVSMGIASVSSGASKLIGRPSSVESGSLESDDTAFVMLERQDTLGENLAVDLVAGTDSAGVLAAGEQVASYLVHFDPVGDTGSESVEGSITFAGEILGVIWSEEGLADTDSILGSIGLYESTNREGDFMGDDQVIISGDGHTLDFILSAQLADIAELRVLTTAVLAGDFNGDGTVDLADYTVWRNNFGATDESTLNWSGDGNGGVDVADYQLWKQNFGGSPPSGYSTAKVPEPSCLTIVIPVLLGAFFYRSKAW